MFAVSFWQAFIAASFLIKFNNAQDSSPTGPTQPNIASNCNAFYTIVGDGGCSAVETKFGITHADFIKWNPDVSEDCLTNFWLGSSYCVGVGAVASSSKLPITSIVSSNLPISSIISSNIPVTSIISSNLPVTSIISSNLPITSSISSSIPITSAVSSIESTTVFSNISSSATANATYSFREPINTWNVSSTTVETAFPPKKTQAGQPSYCINWHLVAAGETCQGIVGSATWATMEQFLQWNPALGSDCSALYDGWWVCTAIQPQSVTVTFEYTTTTTPVEVPDSTAHVSTVFPTANSSFIASPTQTGLASDCKAFYLARANDTCNSITEYGLVTQEQFFSWNPALNGNCNGLWKDNYYCVAAGDSLPAPPTTTKAPASVAQGQISTCVSWYQADESDTCDDIVDMFGVFSKSDFISWNPSVGTDCGGIVEDQFLCVAIPETPTTRTAAAPTTTTPTELPTQSGIASDCEDFWLVSSSDSCSSIAKIKGISETQLLTWNPALGTSTCTNLTPNVYICVSVKGDPVVTTGSALAGPTSTISSNTTISASGAVMTSSAT